MKRLSFSLIALLALFASILAACGQAPAAQPTAAPQPTTAPAPSTGDGMAITGTVTLWHAYGTGSAEEKAINMLIDRARAAYPDATINVLQIPFDQIFNKFNNEVSSGGGPDMFIAPNDSLGSQIRAGVLADLSEYQSKLTDVSPTGVAGMSLDGKLYGIPESFKAVALYYNKSKVANPPATTDELLALVKAGNTLVLNQNAYHNFGWLQAFGGQLMDANGKCIADQAGGAEWFAFLKALKEVPTVTFSTDGGQADSLFKDGKADMIINGPWVLGDYRAVLGDNLGVAPMPGAAKPAGPLTGVDGFYVSINSQNVAGAVALAMFLTSPESMKVYVDEAGHVPVSTKVEISDPLVQAFAQASATGVPRPQIPELDNYWGPFGDAMTKVLDGGADPAAAVAEACALMNTANGK
ncbi:MAG TPA: ABC transporter substrate-binding protein [Chloroflexus aurantiacus]|uniref:Extracellular solute-binding protein family 1 n=1 Tax=Chloroflexus aurantiacus (strain ATCC 29366 / DSM 635 / J-10-fl) TaxID=324602 RepID=A9WE84_CHLAA|nr:MULTISPECIES: extracellular solute-binding protein [Chloroflexus]ABY33744.1 extracellular solute-binding protein family 1 [Chloroflexus aurantiacus J-10-fl]HBW68192.1 ABC transporter substrate-binding protein [Chloroflexus aurantiacus]